MNIKRISYKTTVEIPVTAEELLDEVNGDLFSISPEVARRVTGKKISDGRGKVNFDLTISKLLGSDEVISTISSDEDQTTVEDKDEQ